MSRIRHATCVDFSSFAANQRAHAYARSESPKKNNKCRRILKMGYGIAWLLGVPVSLLILWFVISHL